VGERKGGEHSTQPGGQQGQPGAVGEGGDGGADVEQHLKVIDRRAGPEEVFVVLQLENNEGKDDAQPEAALRGAGDDDEEHAEGDQGRVAQEADDGEVHGAGQPVTTGKYDAAHHHAVLVVYGQQLIEQRGGSDAVVETQNEGDGGLVFVPVGDIAAGFEGAEADVAERNQRENDQQHRGQASKIERLTTRNRPRRRGGRRPRNVWWFDHRGCGG
jgi:hypothetical protein